MTEQAAIPHDVTGITAEWMQRALVSGAPDSASPAVRDVVVERLGSATNAFGNLARCHLATDDGSTTAPETVIAKLPTSDRTAFRFAKWLSLHEREYTFYRRLARLAPIRSPSLLYGAFDQDTHRFVLVLEDLGDMEVIPQIDGVPASRARLAVREIARLHGRFWGADDPSLAGCCDVHGPKYRRFLQIAYLLCLPLVFDRFGDSFSAESRRLAETLGPVLNAHYADIAAGPRTLVHGDYRGEDLFFAADGTDDFAVVDWQGCGLGAGLHDVAYFLGTSVAIEDRRQIEREALKEYHDLLTRVGAADITWEHCWRGYRQNMLTSLVPCVLACGGLDMTDQRLRALGRAGLERILTAIEDLDAGEFLPARRRFSITGNALSTLSWGAATGYRLFRRR